MAQYLHLFETENEFQDKRNNDYFEPWVSLTIESNDRVDYNKSEEEKERDELLHLPLTLTIMSDGNVAWKASDTSVTKTIQYRKNGGSWTQITSATGNSAPTISVVSGDTLEFRGNNNTYGAISNKSSRFSTNVTFSVKGNIMSLIYPNEDTYSTENTFPGMMTSQYAFQGLFYSCRNLVDASKLLLPAISVPVYGYHDMFYYCDNLEMPPKELPATDAAGYVYQEMFYMCKKLVAAPVIAATGVSDHGMQYMFSYCESLEKAPDLLPLTVGSYGYAGMFSDCPNLKYVKCLATTLADQYSTASWLMNVSPTGTFVKKAGVEWASGASGIPSGWTVEEV